MLVVDDETLIRMDLADMASNAGFETVEAGNASQALSILESRDDIRVLCTDIRMPGEMDGLALAHLVRDRWPPTIIVVCSGNSKPLDRELPENAMFLPKPVTGPKVAQILSSILEQIR